MGQNSPEVSLPAQQKLSLIQNWVGLDPEGQILINKITNEHIMRHMVMLNQQQYHQQLSLYTRRINEPQPHIVRIIYYHIAPPRQLHPQQVQQKNIHPQKQISQDYRQFVVYTDQLVPIRDHKWCKDKIIVVFKTVKKLINIYGAFRINENMIWQNQKKQIKIWMNRNPIANHKEQQAKEEQTLADLASILIKKNEQVAGLLMGCKDIKQAIERICKKNQKQTELYANYSHRGQNAELSLKKKSNLIEYRNVFVNNENKKNQINQDNLKINKPNDQPQSKHPEQTSNSNFQQYVNTNITLNVRNSPTNQIKFNNKSIPKFSYSNQSQMSNQFDQSYNKSYTPSFSTTQNKNKLNEEQKNNGSSYLKYSDQIPGTPGTSFIPNHRFQTSADVANVNKFNSPQGFERFINSKESPSFKTSPFTQGLGIPSIKAKTEANKSIYSDEPNEQKRFDITIINNNVNNYINNITHLIPNKDPNYQFKPYKNESKYNPDVNATPVRSNQVSRYNRKPEEEKKLSHTGPTQQGFKDMTREEKKSNKPNIPNFIQQKKKPMNGDQPSFVQKQASKANNSNLIRKQTIYSNPQERQSQPQHFDLDNFYPIGGSYKRSDKKLYTFSNQNYERDHRYSQQDNSKQAIVPTENMHHEVGKQKYNDFKAISRTKTTDFTMVKYQKHNKLDVNASNHNQNKSFTQNQNEKMFYLGKSNSRSPNDSFKKSKDKYEPAHNYQSFHHKSYIKQQSNGQDISQHIPTTKSIDAPELTDKPNKKQLKKKLKMEFGNLLGNDSQVPTPIKQEVVEPVAEDEKQLNRNNSQLFRREPNVKDKIEKKKAAFAQLKKQAHMVLFD